MATLISWIAAAVANAVRYEITGHYAEIRPSDVEGNDTNYDTQAEKIQSRVIVWRKRCNYDAQFRYPSW